ncbi:MAG: GC-type dockerin domain-anchored protein [Phycisphaerales bacterium JB060]
MRTVAVSVALSFSAAASAQGLLDPWAAEVVQYAPGADVPAGFDDPASALGEPSRYTGVGAFPGVVTPFNPPYLAGEVVTIGAGGSLTVRLGTPAIDAATNPFGVDLIVFHNGGYIDAAFPEGVVGGTFFDGGSIEVSQDGVEFFSVAPAAEDHFPTLGYLDLATPYTEVRGDVESDFRRPVDPAIDPDGMGWDELLAAYDGSGGGVGVDIGAVGLIEVNFVRITAGDGETPDIDAVSVVRADCQADVDGNGVLEVFDFLEFQNLFAAGDGRADCDASGRLDIFDFLCFTNLYAGGC